MKVLLVDDHPMICVYLSEVLAKAFEGAAVHVERDLAGALAFAHRADGLDLVLLDLRLPDCTGIETLTKFRGKFPALRVVAVSADDDSASVRAALKAGAAGYVPKGSPPETIIGALKLVTTGGTYMPPEALDDRPARASASSRKAKRSVASDLGLTARQADVLRLALQGKSNRQLVRQLGIAHDTVKQHVSAIYKILGVSSRVELLIAAARRGFKPG